MSMLGLVSLMARYLAKGRLLALPPGEGVARVGHVVQVDHVAGEELPYELWLTVGDSRDPLEEGGRVLGRL